ncbi:transcriptional regulator [Neoasaia chiangmaiensis NBRC 101099]|uniref:SUF system Fe-S cluster assembly regulator n=1 Tax=Neoasaia chiangmaiensis TaxID=320497 RepID=UPI00098B8F9B|nr:SUF system Fe-S cluster assembly regulator [Neoasaia chiangmaiensis]GBR38010.1 transcriptional regulator [Neoasaia chiangmaiensis NBRC 101099]GEN15229.1 SUF system Fe-S cluster assembly regulator [Neoasaia chiangmaiensis]
MLRLSKLADYATVLLVQLGQHDAVVTATALSAETGVPEPTVAKLLKGLASDGLVVSHRGARGGYRLGRALSEISVATVIHSVDGPIAITACVDGNACEARSLCNLSGHWDMVNDAIRNTLLSISLAEMARAPERNAFLNLPPSAQPADGPVSARSYADATAWSEKEV